MDKKSKMKVGFIAVSDRIDPVMIEETVPSDFEVFASSIPLDGFPAHLDGGPFSPDDIYVTDSKFQSRFLSKAKLAELISFEVLKLEKLVDIIVVGYTAGFDKFDSRVPVLYPGKLLWGVVRAMSLKSVVALVPQSGQKDIARKNWRFLIPEVEAYAVAPPNMKLPDDLGKVPVLLDCMEYSVSFKNQIRNHTGQPVYLARSIVRAVLDDI